MKKNSFEPSNLDENLYSALFNTVNEAVVVHYFDKKGNPSNFITVNDLTCKRYGYSREELLKMSPSQIDEPDAFKRYGLPAIKKLMKEGKVNFETIHLTKTGEKIPVEINSVLFYVDGKKAMLSVARDVTERKQTEKRLIESETLFKQIFENMSSGVAIYEVKNNGKEFIIKNFNKTAERMEKIRREDIIGKNVLKIFPGIISFGLYDVMKRVWKTGKSESQPTTLYKDGRISGWKENFVFKISDNEIVSVYDDVTDKKKAEEDIVCSQKLLQRIIDILPIRIFWKDKYSYYLGCNTIFAKDAGKNRPEEILGKDDFQMVWKQQAEAYRNDDLRVIKSGLSKLNFEELQTTPKGEIIWLKTSKMPLTDGNGKTIGILGVYEDITDRKEAEVTLKESEEKYLAILNSSADQIFILDNQFRYKSVSNSLAASLGKKPEEIINKTIKEIYGNNKQSARFSENINNVLKSNKSINIEEPLIIGDKTYYINTQLNPIKDGSGTVTRVLGILRDITERKKVEEELKASKDVLQLKITDLERFNRLSVDRELRMIELKAKIKELEDKLRKR